MNRSGSIILALALALLVFLADQASKQLVEGSMRLGESITAVPNALRLTYTKNEGGAFGILGGQSNVLLLGSVAAVAFVLWLLLKGPPARGTSIGCGLILGGAAGNLLDRLSTGVVTDFLDLAFWPLRQWPIFNTADAAIVGGVAILFFVALLPERANQPSTVSDREKAEG
ncbi:MAG: signal peptidase II [Actinobacteria bacterium]|nr:signal peptidase II [Actinomycetota bacterium]